jgi:hypothetical protein
MIQVTLEGHLARANIPRVNFSVTPAGDELGHTVGVYVKTVDVIC